MSEEVNEETVRQSLLDMLQNHAKLYNAQNSLLAAQAYVEFIRAVGERKRIGIEDRDGR